MKKLIEKYLTDILSYTDPKIYDISYSKNEITVIFNERYLVDVYVTIYVSELIAGIVTSEIKEENENN